MNKTKLILALAFIPSMVFAETNIPANCIVQNWCVIKASQCFFGYMANPQGLYQAHSQYSVIRKLDLICEDNYGNEKFKTIQTPVEPVPFRGTIETTPELATQAAMELCEKYRKDWVDTAPVCH